MGEWRRFDGGNDSASSSEIARRIRERENEKMSLISEPSQTINPNYRLSIIFLLIEINVN